jgi:sec-independent protein translocase protein TatC
MSFVLLLPLAFGVSFQLPLVMLFLERIGLVTVKGYLSSWRMAVLIIFVLAMLLTPTGDPYTLLLMACPLTVLYFGGVLICKVWPRPKSRIAE